MTKSLTEQWKDGELPEGYYYIRWSFNIDDEPSYMIDFYDREMFVGGAFINKQRKFIDEIVSAVPSYEEYNELVLHILEKRLEVSEKEHYRTLEQLRIATKALKELELKSDKFYRGDHDWSLVEQLDFIKARCQETLYQIEEVK